MGKRLASLLRQLKKQTLRPLRVVKPRQLSLISRNPTAAVLTLLLDFWAFIVALVLYMYGLVTRLIASAPLVLEISLKLASLAKSRLIGSLIF